MPTSLAPMRLGQKRRADATSRKLLESALVLIAERGYEATTSADIGRHAGYSRAMVHARFGSKDSLFDSLLKSEYEDRLLPPASEALSGRERALGVIDRLLALAQENPQLVRAIFVLLFESSHRSSVAHQRIRAWMLRLETFVEAAFSEGLADGSVAPGIDPKQAAHWFMTAGIGACFLGLAQPFEANLATELRAFRARMLEQVCHPPHVTPVPTQT